jgi:hypothetical protein
LAYDSCQVLPLKIFFQVAETGNLNLLAIQGRPNNLIDIWQKILIEYGELDGNYLISDTFDKQGQIVRYAATYLEVDAMLIYLKHFKYDQDYVDRLLELGYRINPENYITDVERNQRTVKNIKSRIMMLQNEIESLKTDSNKSSFDEAISYLASNLNTWVPDDITVSRYVTLKRVIREKNGRHK